MSAYLYPKPPVRRRPGSKAARIEAALLEEVEALRRDRLMPTSGRFLFYRLVALGVVEKQRVAGGRPRGRQPAQDVSKVLTELREANVVYMDEIRDRTRGVVDWRGHRSVREAVLRFVGSVDLDPWAGSPPVLIVESESLAGVLEPLAAEYRIPLAPLGGQGRTSMLGADLPRYLHDGASILYLGDLDLSGGQIEESARARAQAYSGFRLRWRRLALTAGQAAEHGLEPIVKADARYKPARWQEAIESEALDQRVLVRIVRAELDALLPRALTEVEQQEQAERQAVIARLNGAEAP